MSFALAVAVGALALAPSAHAAPGISVGMTFPDTVKTGAVGLAGSLTVTAVGDTYAHPISADRYIGICTTPVPKHSDCDEIGTPWDSGITVTPSCAQAGEPSTTTPVCQVADPGVFRLSATGLGATGTTCAGVTFDIAEVDAATGMLRFTPSPSAAYVSLGAPGSSCRVDFTFDVLKEPADAMPATDGVQTGVLASAGGWYHVNEKKKAGPLKAVGSEIVTMSETTKLTEFMKAGISGPTRCVDGTTRPGRVVVNVSVEGDAANIVRVDFLREGSVIKTLTSASDGVSTFTLKRSEMGLRMGRNTFSARVVVRAPGSFLVDREKLVEKLGRVSFPAAQDCRPARAGRTFAQRCFRYQVDVHVSARPRQVERVEFLRNGAVVQTLVRPTRGRHYVLRGARIFTLRRPFTVTPRVVLRAPRSFRKHEVLRDKTLRPVRFAQARDCFPPPDRTTG
jgi:hypothetical protein